MGGRGCWRGRILAVVGLALTTAVGGTAQPQTSLVFASSREYTGGDVFVMGSDGTGLRNLTADLPEPAMLPAASRDGKKIAFVYEGAIWAMDGDGSHKRRVSEAVGGRRPTWSPDGRQLAYVAESYYGGLTWEKWHETHSQSGWGPYDIFILGWADRTIRNLTESPVEWPDPAWSPDGARIAYQRPYNYSNTGDIWVVGVEGTPATQVTYQDSVLEDFSWSPDGTQLVYSAYHEASGYAIWFINPDGSGRRPLEFAVEVRYVGSPSWSLDGRQLALQAGQWMGNGDIWVVGVDGTDPVQLTNHPAWYSKITWVPTVIEVSVTSSSWGAVKRDSR